MKKTNFKLTLAAFTTLSLSFLYRLCLYVGKNTSRSMWLPPSYTSHKLCHAYNYGPPFLPPQRLLVLRNFSLEYRFSFNNLYNVWRACSSSRTHWIQNRNIIINIRFFSISTYILRPILWDHSGFIQVDISTNSNGAFYARFLTYTPHKGYSWDSDFLLRSIGSPKGIDDTISIIVIPTRVTTLQMTHESVRHASNIRWAVVCSYYVMGICNAWCYL